MAQNQPREKATGAIYLRIQPSMHKAIKEVANGNVCGWIKRAANEKLSGKRK
jgi:predicted HicB family RNase H-like nuclease